MRRTASTACCKHGGPLLLGDMDFKMHELASVCLKTKQVTGVMPGHLHRVSITDSLCGSKPQTWRLLLHRLHPADFPAFSLLLVTVLVTPSLISASLTLHLFFPFLSFILWRPPSVPPGVCCQWKGRSAAELPANECLNSSQNDTSDCAAGVTYRGRLSYDIIIIIIKLWYLFITISNPYWGWNII